TPPADRAFRARGTAAYVRAPAAAARDRRQEALEAPWRRLRAGVPGRRLPARGPAQLPRPARLGLRRQLHLLRHRAAGREVQPRARVALAGGVRRAEAELDERAVPAPSRAAGAGR